MSRLTGQHLEDYDEYLLQLLDETPTIETVQLLRKLQSDKRVTTTIAIMEQNNTTLPLSSDGDDDDDDEGHGDDDDDDDDGDG